MENRAEYYKSKVKESTMIGGGIALKPPVKSASLSSSTTLSVIDLLCEGPIEGLTTRDGKRSKGFSFLESVYLDNIPVKEADSYQYDMKNIVPNNVEFLSGLNQHSVDQALINISGHLHFARAQADAKNRKFYDNQFDQMLVFSGELVEYVKDHQNELGHLGILQFKTNNLWTNSDNEFFRINYSGDNQSIYLTSNLRWETFYGGKQQERLIQKSNDDVVKIPETITYIAPTFTENYSSSSNVNDIDGLRVGKKYKVSNFAGGGIMFFHIGNNVSQLSNSAGPTEFNTGKFYASVGDLPTLFTKIKSAREDFHDLFVFDNINNTIALAAATPSQKAPTVGEINEQPIKLGFLSDLNGRYNYNNVSFDFRNGYENQPILDGYSDSSRDIPIGKRLLGPFSQDLNSDIRELGDFARWNTVPKLDHDAYPVTHTISDYQVDKASVTVSVHALFNTQSAGDDAGRQTPNKVDFVTMAGYELSDKKISPSYINALPIVNVIQDVIVKISDESDPSNANYLTIERFVKTPRYNTDTTAIKLRNPTTNNLDSVAVGTDMRTYGLTQFDVGSSYYSILKFSIDQPAEVVYTSLDQANIFTLNGNIQDVEYANGITFNAANGQLNTNVNGQANSMANGLIMGTTVVDDRFTPPLYTANFSVPLSSPSLLEEYGNLAQALAAGITLRDYVLSTYTILGNFSVNGISMSQYNATIPPTTTQIPKNKDLKNIRIQDIVGMTANLASQYALGDLNDLVFPGETWKEPRRFVSVTKKDYETDSVLQEKQAYVNHFTEIIENQFTYPYSALSACSIDARTFNRQPARSFDARLKKILVPSNYIPLNGDGSDKRFVEKTTNYGKRNIYLFKKTSGNQANNAIRVRDEILLDKNNFEITVKVASHKNGGTSQMFATNTTQTIFYGRSYYGNNLASARVELYLFTNSANSLTRFDARFAGTAHRIYGVIPATYARTNYFDADGNPKYVYEASFKVTQSKLILSVVIKDLNGNTVHTVTPTESVLSATTIANNRRANFRGLGTLGTLSDSSFYIGGRYNGANHTNSIRQGVQLADIKIKRNNQLIHHWDGTVIDGADGTKKFKDRFGAHGDFTESAAIVTEEDTNFIFGKNKAVVYNGEWDGTFKLAWSDNPAWILYDLMVNPIYGVGNRIDEREDINIFKLYEMGRYADAVDDEGGFDGVSDAYGGLEPRFSCNILLYDSKNAYSVLSNIASIFRSITYWDGSHFSFATDKPKEANAIFSNSNVFDGQFIYSDVLSNARFNRVEVPYADKNDNYVVKVEYVEDEESIRKYGLVVNKSNGIGCTSKSQAKRMGKYILLSNKLETEIVKFQAGAEALMITPGDIIQVQDELKNFEIGYGKVLEVFTGAQDGNGTNPHIKIDKSINVNSINVGQSSEFYTYNNKDQNEIKNLYNVYNYNLSQTFGVDEDSYTGVVPLSEMKDIEKLQVSKFTINTIDDDDRYLKLNIATNKDITGVQTGAQFQVKLENTEPEKYKVINISKSEPNLYDVSALQFEERKFTLTEADDFDFDNNKHNIGIPLNVINRPLTPAGVTVGSFTQSPDLSFTVPITIVSVGGQTNPEKGYRITAVRKDMSGPYIQKTVARNSSGTTLVTMGGLKGGSSGATYVIKVTSLKNPESSKPFEVTIQLPHRKIIYTKRIINDITLTTSNSQNYFRTNATGYGSGTSIIDDLDFRFNLQNQFGDPIYMSSGDASMNIYIENSNGYKLVQSGYNSDVYSFTNVDNALQFGSLTGNVNFKFDMLNQDQVEDTAFYSGFISQ